MAMSTSENPVSRRGLILSRVVLVICLLASCSPTRGCIESQFKLAPESRLPTWLRIPSDVSRSEVSLELYYYAPLSDSVDDTVFVATVKGMPRQEISARHWWHPRTKRQLDVYYATEPRPKFPHPSYVVVEVNSEIDVIEHRKRSEQNREPTGALFWMTDNPDILREGRESKSNAASLR